LYYKTWVVPVSFIVIILGSNITTLQAPIKELLRVDFKQKTATITGFFIEITILGILILVLNLIPSLTAYLAVFLTTSICAFGVWLIILTRIYNYTWIFNCESIKLLKYSIKDFSLWNHFNGAITNLIYNIDTAILSLLGISLSAIGNYTVALKLSNFFFIAPMLLQGVNTIAVANMNEKTSNIGINLFLKYSFVLSLTQLLIFILFGEWVIESFITQKATEAIFTYGLLIITGVSILNIGRPLISWITIKGSLKEAFFRIYLPSGIIGIFIYFLLGIFFGATGVACGNIVVYSLFLSLVIIYVLHTCPFKLKLYLFTSQEKELIFQVMKKIDIWRRN
jgi:O-antigen/teichoic acid export membrane protein